MRSWPRCNKLVVSHDLGPPSSPSASAASVARAEAVLSNDEPERTTPEPLVIARWMALRWTERSSTVSRIRPSPMPEPSGPSDCGAAAVAVTDGNSPWAKRSAMSSAIRWANTRPSRSELDASRLAPCTPVQEHSPQA